MEECKLKRTSFTKKSVKIINDTDETEFQLPLALPSDGRHLSVALTLLLQQDSSDAFSMPFDL